MPEFHKGQRVRIRQWDDMVEEYGIRNDQIPIPFVFTRAMQCLCGKEFEILRIIGKQAILSPNPNNFSISVQMLEMVEDDTELEVQDNSKLDKFLSGFMV